MDARLRPLSLLLRSHDGARCLRPAPRLGPQTALHRGLLWVHRVDPVLRYRGESEAVPTTTPSHTEV
jgi:hypothetical protein